MSRLRSGCSRASDNLAYGYVQGGFVYNFWQDDAHNLGLWRRTSPASYKSAAPEWETVIDFDALAAAEGTNWVYSNADCLGPEYRRCLISMSPDGGDALEIREFDLASKSFVKDGFFSPMSKSAATWLDADTLILMPAYERASRRIRAIRGRSSCGSAARRSKQAEAMLEAEAAISTLPPMSRRTAIQATSW